MTDAANAPDPSALKAIVDRYVEVASGRDVEAYVDLFAEDAVIIDPVGTPAHVGRDAVRAFRQSAVDAVTSMDFTAHGTRAAGDHVAFNFVVKATVGGAQMLIEGIEIFQIEAGKITHMTAIWGEADASFG
jgi:steroid delta-isomerase